MRMHNHIHMGPKHCKPIRIIHPPTLFAEMFDVVRYAFSIFGHANVVG
jgi:hypothetical protein